MVRPVWVQFESSLIHTGLRLSGFFIYIFLNFYRFFKNFYRFFKNLVAPRDATRDARSERSPGTRLHTHPGTQLHECAVQV